MKFDIIPKFREIDIYAVSLSLIIVYLLSFGIPEPGPTIGFFIESPFSLLFVAVFGYLIIRSLHHAWVPGLPGKSEADVLVFFALFATSGASAFGALVWFQRGFSTDPLSIILAIFTALGLLRAIGILLILKFASRKTGDHFVFHDTPRWQTILITAAVLATAIIGHFMFGVTGILLYLAMIELSRFVPTIKK